MYRHDFPLFAEQPDLAYFDSAATAQKPQVVLDAVRQALVHAANPDRGLYPLSTEATELVEKVRQKVADFISSPKADQVVFTANATEAFNLVTHGLAEGLKAGDEIVLSNLEHTSVTLPWRQLALQKGLLLHYLPHDSQTGRLQMGELLKLVNSRTKVISLSVVSNVYGTRSQVEKTRKIVEQQGSRALIVLDACQAAPHEALNVQELGADVVIFSGHKLYAPTSTGVLWGSPALFNMFGSFVPTRAGGGSIETLRPDEIMWKKSPQRVAGGTPAVESIAGLGAAIDYTQGIGWDKIRSHTAEMVALVREKLTSPRITWLTQESDVTILSFSVVGAHPHDIADALGSRGVCVRAGLHCAHGLFKANDSGYVRLSFGVYNTREDVEKLAAALTEVLDLYHE